ncbi:MAG: MFS transporter [Geodermatophilaceae bacterium]
MLTSIYSTFLAVGLTFASVLTVPISQLGGSWRVGLAAWGVTAAVAALPWLGLVRHDVRPETAAGNGTAMSARAVARSSLAWAMALFFASQSLQAYAIFGWLPQIFRDAGFSAETAGLLLGLTTAISIPISFALPAMVVRRTNQTSLILALCASYVVGYVGLILWPAAGALAWAVLIGIGTGMFPLALTLIGLRARTSDGTAALSGFTQSVGYLIAAVGPFMMGAGYDATGGWTVPLIVLTVLIVPQAVTGWMVARPRYVEDEVAQRAATPPSAEGDRPSEVRGATVGRQRGRDPAQGRLCLLLIEIGQQVEPHRQHRATQLQHAERAWHEPEVEVSTTVTPPVDVDPADVAEPDKRTLDPSGHRADVGEQVRRHVGVGVDVLSGLEQYDPRDLGRQRPGQPPALIGPDIAVVGSGAAVAAVGRQPVPVGLGDHQRVEWLDGDVARKGEPRVGDELIECRHLPILAEAARGSADSPTLHQVLTTGRRIVGLRPEVRHAGDEPVTVEREEHHAVGPVDTDRPLEPDGTVGRVGDHGVGCQVPVSGVVAVEAQVAVATANPLPRLGQLVDHLWVQQR